MYNGIYNKEQFAYMYDTLVKWLTARAFTAWSMKISTAAIIKGMIFFPVFFMGYSPLSDLAAQSLM